jgi:hypothetical protein
MVEVGDDPDLAKEAFGSERGGQLGAQHLDRHVSLVLEVASEIHRPHPTGTEAPLHSVPTCQSTAKAIQIDRVSHVPV